jgi:carboxyl-terminal processing protease
MIVLVNEHSASASEIVSGSLMDNKRALVIGTRTYGKGSVQEVIPLDEKGGELKLTVAYYYLPSGKCVHRLKDATDWGVDPQIVVPMDAAAEEQLLKDHYEEDLFRRPIAKATTISTTQIASTVTSTTVAATPSTTPATQPTLDVQLQRAVDTMVALVVLQGEKVAGAPPSSVVPPIAMTVGPATAPTTAPSDATNP